MGFWKFWIVLGVVDRIDLSGLGIARCRRKGEVRVTAFLVENDEFIVDTAAGTILPRVV